MAGFSRIKELVNCQVSEGNTQYSSFRKISSNVTSAGIWYDMSMFSGNPVANFYASSPLIAETLDGDKGIYHGQNVSPMKKFVGKITTFAVSANAVPITMMLCDYLLYYPFVDMDSTDEQALDNTNTLPRYESGEGVKMFLVALTPYTGSGTFTITYTNSDGVSGRTTDIITSNVSTSISSFIHSGPVAKSFGPFIPLAQGDRGVRSVESITFITTNGGLCAIVLVKPLCQTTIREITAPRENDYFINTPSMPNIIDGAYLNFIALTNASISTIPISGDITTIWN